MTKLVFTFVASLLLSLPSWCWVPEDDYGRITDLQLYSLSLDDFEAIPSQSGSFKLKPDIVEFTGAKGSKKVIVYLEGVQIGFGKVADVYPASNKRNGDSDLALRIPRQGEGRNETGLIGLLENYHLSSLRFFYSPRLKSLVTSSKLGQSLEDYIFKNFYELSDFNKYLHFIYKFIHDLSSQILGLNQAGFFHGAIKPKNVVFHKNNYEFELIDLDEIPRIDERKYYFTPGYRPEGVDQSEINHLDYGLRVDLYAIGKSIFDILWFWNGNRLRSLSVEQLVRLEQLKKLAKSLAPTKQSKLKDGHQEYLKNLSISLELNEPPRNLVELTKELNQLALERSNQCQALLD